MIMKRYKDCKIISRDGLSVSQILEVVEAAARNKSYKTERNSCLRIDDVVMVYFRKQDLPYSRIIISSSERDNSVYIVNVVPMPESGVSHISIEDYNKILDIFRADVLDGLSEDGKFNIEETSEDYTIEDIIPKSYPALKRWLDGYPLSGHPHDLHRWYDFVICLHRNEEQISLDTFGKYLKEACKWDDETIDEWELKLESHLDLLEYYTEHR